MKSLLLASTLVLICQISYSQVIWSEDFQSYASGTTVGGNNNTANPAADWTISCAGCGGTFETATGIFGTSFFLASNIDAVGTWTSETIDISAGGLGTGLAVLDMIVGVVADDDGDFIRAYYTLDGGARTLFYEVEGALTIDLPATAILQGNSVVIEVEFFNDDGGFFGADAHTIDDITITAITNLYSRQSTDLATSGTWSVDAYSGPDCGCTPGATNIINIGDGHDVTMVADATVAAVNIENGSLSINGAVDLNINYGSTLNIDAGSTLTTNNAGSQINLLSFADYIFDLDGDLDVGIIASDDSKTITAQGSGSLNTRDAFFINTDGSVINNMTSFTIGDQLEFTGDDGSLTNNGTVSISGDLVVTQSGFFGSNDRSTITNNGTLNITDIDPNNEDLIIVNNSIINQTGAFINGGIDGDSDFTNASGATWNWSGTTYDADVATNFDATASGNTFDYNGSGAQPVISMSYDNISFSNSGTKSTDGNIDVNGNLLITGSAILDVNSGNDNITIAGDWTNNSSAGDSFLQGTELVTFDGTADQDILGVETFHNVTIDKSNNVNLSANVEIGGTIIFTDGFVNLGNNDLVILSTGSTSGGSSTSHVITSENGELVQQGIGNGARAGDVNFPIGRTSGSYTPLVINNASGTADAFSVTVGNNVFEEGTFESGTLVTDEVVQKTWFITESVPGGSNATLTFQWNTADEGSMFDRSMIDVNRHDGMIWNAIEVGTAAAGGNPYTVQTTGVSEFSPLALSGINILPVELVYFKGEMAGRSTKLSWETALELNNDYFILEKTLDGRTFKEVAIIGGQGTKNSSTTYTSYDEMPFSGRSYYRLTQVDFDGTKTVFDLIAIDNPFDSWEISVFPVPNDGREISIQIMGIDETIQLNAEITDSQGRSMGSYPVELIPFNDSRAEIRFNQQLPSGVYVISLDLPDPITRRILVK